MHIALVDDEPVYLESMTQFCQEFGKQQHCQIQVSPFTSGQTFLEAFETNQFSIIFMDIYMDPLDGISTALEMRKKDSGCLLVFLTSSPEFMPDAFSCHAFDYIVKPFSAPRIHAVLTDALKVLPDVPKYIEILSERKTTPVFLHDIFSAVTDAHYIEISLADGNTLRSRMTMNEFLRLTGQDSRFILVNKGIALNADHILGFEGNSCILGNGSRFPVRVRDYQQIEQAVQNYHFEKIRTRQHQHLASSWQD